MAVERQTVCLICPPSIFLLDERVFVSLGILKVAAVLEQRGYPVEMVDLSGIANFEEAIEAHAKESKALWFGITATTPQMPAVAKIIKRIRQCRPDAKIVLGGPHPTLVQAAWKREKKLGTEGRGTRSLNQLLEMADVTVAGDGEDAIFQAINSTGVLKLIDADDPKGPLFLTNKRLEESPFPARHLVDMDSYHYSVDGVKASSLVAQLGCLVAGTRVKMADGSEKTIETVTVGDMVVCWDDMTNQLTTAPVAAAWSRTAADIWNLETEQGRLQITTEHPVWTTLGWKIVGELDVERDYIGFVPEMWEAVKEGAQILRERVQENESSENLSSVSKEFRADSSVRPRDQLLLKELSSYVDAQSCEPEVAAGRATSNAREVGRYDTRRAPKEFQHPSTYGECKDTEGSEIAVGYQEGCAQSNEAPRGSAESIGHDDREVGTVLPRSDDPELEGRQDAEGPRPRQYEKWAEQSRAAVAGHTGCIGTDVQICGKFSILDRSLRLREMPEPGLRGQHAEEGDTDARGILAFSRERSAGGDRLYPIRVESNGNLGETTTDQRSERSRGPNTGIRFTRIISKNLIGAGRVYNITVCPGHSYVAENIVVHNCPYGCNFCGGRESSMLRRIRTRSTTSILKEMEMLVTVYGICGFQFYDDELNVNKNMIELMQGIVALQQRLGVEFRLRGFVKSELFNEQQAEWMYKAGFRWLLCGFEAGHERILHNINKKATVADNDRMMAAATKYGLKVKALMSIGHAGESPETVQAVEDWLLKVKPADFDVTVITTYPGTPYYDHAVETSPGIWTYTVQDNGDRLHSLALDYNETADYYKGDPDGGYKAYVFTDHITSEQLVTMRDNVERTVRTKLGIPYNIGAAAMRYEHSMGQSGTLPLNILRKSGA